MRRAAGPCGARRARREARLRDGRRPVLALVALLAGCASSVEGSLRSTGRPLGEWELSPDECHSGEREGFFGVDLVDSSRPELLVRIVETPLAGYQVAVPNVRDGGHRILDGSGCEQFDIRVIATDTTINDVRALDGRADILCRFPGGGTLQGSLTFETCH